MWTYMIGFVNIFTLFGNLNMYICNSFINKYVKYEYITHVDGRAGVAGVLVGGTGRLVGCKSIIKSYDYESIHSQFNIKITLSHMYILAITHRV